MHTKTDQGKGATLLKSREAVEDIRTRQAHQVTVFREQGGSVPKLAIVQIKDDPVINTYVAAKKRYGSTIGVDVDIHAIAQENAAKTIKGLNNDISVHGIIVQLPITDTSETEDILELVKPEKDVDGLRRASPFTPATPLAILQLLEHYDVDLKHLHVVVVGRGLLVGTPLLRLLDERNVAYDSLDKDTENNKQRLKQADVIITATGYPGLITAEDIKQGATVVDAGTSTAGGKTVGDVAPDAYDRSDISITPKRGGVGPLTVCALFSNVLHSYEDSLKS